MNPLAIVVVFHTLGPLISESVAGEKEISYLPIGSMIAGGAKYIKDERKGDTGTGRGSKVHLYPAP